MKKILLPSLIFGIVGIYFNLPTNSEIETTEINTRIEKEVAFKATKRNKTTENTFIESNNVNLKKARSFGASIKTKESIVELIKCQNEDCYAGYEQNTHYVRLDNLDWHQKLRGKVQEKIELNETFNKEELKSLLSINNKFIQTLALEQAAKEDMIGELIKEGFNLNDLHRSTLVNFIKNASAKGLVARSELIEIVKSTVTTKNTNNVNKLAVASILRDIDISGVETQEIIKNYCNTKEKDSDIASAMKFQLEGLVETSDINLDGALSDC